MRRIVASALGIAMSGCSTAHSISGFSSLPLATISRAAARDAVAQFTIRWPSDRTQVLTAHGPLWISPSAASLAIEINDAVIPSIIVNAPKPVGESRSTTVRVKAPLGSDRFAMTLYDRKQKDGAALPVGNLVGEATVRENIVGAKVNEIKAIVTGVVGRIGIEPTPNEPFVTADGSTAGFDLVGDAPEQFTLTAEDNDGNVIVPQPRKFMLKAVSSAYLKVTQPSVLNGQTFLVSVVSPLPTGVTTGLEASVADAWGTAQTSVAVSETHAIYVGYSGVPTGLLSLVAYDGSKRTQVPLPSSAFAGLGSVSALAYDYTHHHLVIGDSTNGFVRAYDGAGNAVASFTPIRVTAIKAVAYDSINQMIYVNGDVDGVIGIFAYSSAGVPIPLQQPAFKGVNPSGPLAIVASSGAIVIGQSAGGGGFGSFTASGALTSSSSIPVTGILGLATDYLTAGSGSAGPMDVFAIGMPTTGGFGNLFDITPGVAAPLELAALDDPRAIAQDPVSGDLYVANASGSVVPLGYLSWTPGRAIRAVPGFLDPTALAIAY